MSAHVPEPAALGGFPRLTAADTPDPLYRIFQPVDPATGTARTAWFFSSRSSRFDLPAPYGTCYFSDRRYGAWLEVFRGCGLVDRADVERRRLLTATRTGRPLRLANLRAAQARPFGVTADLVAGDDHTQTQAWAVALHTAGFEGLAATIRHDPTLAARNLALFGRIGPRTRSTGWRTTTSRLVDDIGLLEALAPFGTGVVGRPWDVTVTHPAQLVG